MSLQSTWFGPWDEAHREFAIACEGLADEDLWTRPEPRLLSVGELAGHIAYWQAVHVFGGGDDRPDPDQLSIRSPLVDARFRYYTTNVDHPVTLDMGVQGVLQELARIHDATKEALKDKLVSDPVASFWGNWGTLVQYQVFHVAYHTGQAYSVRHLLGHETEDN